MWYVPESVMLARAALELARRNAVNELAQKYLFSELRAGYRGNSGAWKGVVKYKQLIVYTCDCTHKNRSQSSKLNGCSALDCAKGIVSECAKLQFYFNDNGEPAWSLENASEKLHGKNSVE